MSGPVETEVKIALTGVEQGRRLLRGAGFRESRPRVHETNLILDDVRGSLRRRGLLLRVRALKRRGREVGTLCTFKGPARLTRRNHKTREEREFDAADSSRLLGVFNGLGYRPSFRYEKFRTEFSHPRGTGLAVLDETPMGVFLELEGTSTWIDITAARLGFSPDDYITLSYASLWAEWRKENRIRRSDMIFS